MADFPDSAMRRISIGDLSIIKAWERTRIQNHGRRVRIWSLDQHLVGYDSNPYAMYGSHRASMGAFSHGRIALGASRRG